jgi:hypothetical protein
MANFCLNYMIILSAFGIAFFSILGVMIFFKSEALGINENNKTNNTLKVGITALV